MKKSIEKLEIFNLKGKSLGIQDRANFYAEIKKEFLKNKKITRKVKAIRLLLMNSNGRIYLQKRSNLKTENSGLYDKTVGGHVLPGESWNVIVVRECAEELGFPAVILDNDFKNAVATVDLKIIGIFKQVDELVNFESVRIDKSGNEFTQPYISTFFVGYYDGAIRFVDGESSGVEVFSLKELENEIKNSPAKFTEDIKFMIKNYKQHLKPVNKM